MTEFKQIIGRGTPINKAFYAHEGLEPTQDSKILQLPPFDQMGTPAELVKHFSGKAAYQDACRALATLRYTASG